jgi:hypothetical protein
MAETRISDISALIYAGIDKVFNAAAKKPRRQYWQQIVREESNEKKYGWYDTLGDIGPAQEHNESDTILFNKIEYNNRTTIETKVYTNGVQGSLEATEFDLQNVVKRQFGEPLVKTMISKKERIVAAVYNNVFTATGADGVYQASASHPLKNSVLLNNNLLTGELSASTIAAAKNRFNFIYDQAGDFFDTEATHLLIHPNKMFLALQLLNSNLMALELSNTKNVLQDVMPIKILVDKYLTYNTTTDVSPWHMLDKSLEAGCILQKKGGLTLKTWWDYNTLAYKGIAYEMYGAGIICPGYGHVSSTGA